MTSRLSVLGTSDLRSADGVQVRSVLQQPRRFGLLAYLALASREGPVRRESVLSVFWADSTPERARGALSQAVFYLRRSLGANVVVGRGAEEIGLDHDAVRCDAVEFLEAVEGESWEEAVELYGGELLPGFDTGGACPDFDRWLDARRRHLRRAASDASWHVAERAEEEGDGPRAVLFARRACDWSGCDEVHVRRLMATLDRLGDRAGVIGAYESLERALEPLGASPSPATAELMASLRQGWEKQDAGARSRAARPVPDPGREPVSASPPSPRRSHRWAQLASWTVTAALTVVFVSLWGLRRPEPGPTRRTAETTLLVEGLAPLDGGIGVSVVLQEEMVRQLQGARALDVFVGGDPEAAGARFVLRGSVTPVGDGLRIHASLFDGESGVNLQSTRIDVPEADALVHIDSAAEELAVFARRAIGEALLDARLARARAPTEAIDLVRRAVDDRALGDSLYAAGQLDAAATSFNAADSLLALAADLAESWELPWVERAGAAYASAWLARRQQRREDAEFLGRTALAYAHEAVRRNDESPDAFETRAKIGHWLWALTKENPPEDHQELLHRAMEDALFVTTHDPDRAQAWSTLAATYLAEGEFADASWALHQALEADTYLREDMGILVRLFQVSWEMDHMATAEDWCLNLERRVSTGGAPAFVPAHCALHVLAVSDAPDTRAVDSVLVVASRRSVSAVEMARLEATAAVAFARAGDEDRAVALLEALPESDDADMVASEAWGWLALGDTLRAEHLLRGIVEGHPVSWQSMLRSRRFAGLGLRLP